MKSTFNINKIIAQFELDEKKLASELFKGNTYPELALKRITSGQAVLDITQIETLASILGVHVSQLFTQTEWCITAMTGENCIVLTKNNYTVKLNTHTYVSAIYKGNALIAKETLFVSGEIKLSEYIKTINNYFTNNL